ncbi:MAG: GAF domain-containing protein [Spirulina sp.]
MAQLQPPESRHDQPLVSLSRALKAIRAAQSAADALVIALDHLHATFAFEVAWIGLYDSVRHRLVTQEYRGPDILRPMRAAINLTPGDLMEQTVIHQRPLMVADLQNEIRAGEWGLVAKQFALQSAVIYPIKRQETCFGLLVMASPRWGVTLSLGDLSYLSIVAGTLAEVLHHFQADQQRQQAKRLEQPLLSLLGRLGSLGDLDSQIKEVVRETQRFMAPSRSRVFWLEAKGSYFWQRQPSTHAASAEDRAFSLPVAEVRGLYQALCHQQLVVLGESRGALNGVVPDRLMQQLQAQAIMIAPIAVGEELVGFLSVESGAPRLWQESEKQFLMGMARLLSLALPVASHQETQRHSQIEQSLATGVMQGIHNERDWRHALQTCFTNLSEHLGIQQFFVLVFNAERQVYELCFHGQAHRIPGTAPLWPGLDEVDWHLLERSALPVAIDNLSQDLKLMAWRPHLLELGAKAVMASNVAPGHKPEGVVVVSDRTPRQWTTAEQTLMMAVGRQIGVILHQWQLQRQMDQQQETYEALEWGLKTLHQSAEIDHLERTTLEYVLQWLQGSMALLVTWQPGEAEAQVSQIVDHNSRPWAPPKEPIPLNDALLQWAIQTEDLLTLSATDLPADTQAWLLPPQGSRIVTKALRTAPNHAVTAALIVTSVTPTPWGKHQITIVNLLINQLAWSRRYLYVLASLTQQRQDLEHLNWYKHHCLEETYRQLAKVVQDLSPAADQPNSSAPAALPASLRQLQRMVQGSTEVLQRERWQLRYHAQTTPLISLINRAIERITPALESRQLWSKVHNDSDRGTLIAGDTAKLDMVLYEILIAACQRSPVGGRIDLWCRLINFDWLELSITDNGHCNPTLLGELKAGSNADVLAPSSLDEPPGLHLAICKSLLDQLGGEVSFSQLEDGRIHSRLLLPLAHSDSRHGE